MNKLVMTIAALSLVACTADPAAVDRDHDLLKTDHDRLERVEKKLDQLIASGGRGAGAQQRPQRPEPDRAKTYAMPIDGDPFDGPADAKVTLVKAYDYACPYCERVRDTMEELKKKYGNDLRIVYKQYVVHPQVATAGALASCAASRQGKFDQMDNALWDKGFKGRQFDKDAPGEGGGPAKRCWDSEAGCPIVLGFATDLGMNADKFKADMKECNALIQKDQKDLQQLGVAATPSFFINGRFMSGAMPIENFTTLIDEELKKANDRIASGTPAAQYYQQWVLDKGLKSLEPMMAK